MAKAKAKAEAPKAEPEISKYMASWKDGYDQGVIESMCACADACLTVSEECQKAILKELARRYPDWKKRKK